MHHATKKFPYEFLEEKKSKCVFHIEVSYEVPVIIV